MLTWSDKFLKLADLINSNSNELINHCLPFVSAEGIRIITLETKRCTNRRIPALLMRIVTPPNASNAVLMTASPSATEEVFATALPPATRKIVRQANEQTTRVREGRTFRDLGNNFFCGVFADIINDDIGPSRGEEDWIAFISQTHDPSL